MKAFFVPLAMAAMATAAGAQTVAVTELLNNAIGEDDGREFVELYNYGSAPVGLLDYTLSDEDTDVYTFDDVTIEPGDFLILVGGSLTLSGEQKKATFEADWLGGLPDDRVIGIDVSWAVGNGGDEIILADPTGAVIWSLAYSNDETEGNATFLTPGDFSVTSFGTKAAPGVVREGDDNGVVDFLGYESNDSVLAVDPDAFFSANGDVASPFATVMGGPRLAVSGECPGEVVIEASGLTPFSLAALLFATSEGSETVAGGPCSGLVTGLGAGFLVVQTATADDVGNVVLGGAAPDTACLGFVQVVDGTLCEATQVGQVP